MDRRISSLLAIMYLGRSKHRYRLLNKPVDGILVEDIMHRPTRTARFCSYCVYLTILSLGTHTQTFWSLWV